jgi:hypothetical protein
MSLNINIQDGGGNGRKAFVDAYNALCVTLRDPAIPEVGEPSRLQYFNAVVGSTGADSGTTNMNVDGSSTTQEFYVESNNDYDIRIMQIVVIIADSAIVHNSFGNVSALANGWDLVMKEAGVETTIINAAKTGGQVIAQSGLTNSYGDGATSFELTNWTGTEDAQTVVIDVSKLVPGGIRIGRGTKDRLISRVNDDLTGLTEFTVRILGYRHYP